jgi:hypothetical protein
MKYKEQHHKKFPEKEGLMERWDKHNEEMKAKMEE